MKHGRPRPAPFRKLREAETARHRVAEGALVAARGTATRRHPGVDAIADAARIVARRDRGDAVAGGSGDTRFTKRGGSGSSVSLRARGVVRRRVITQRGRR